MDEEFTNVEENHNKILFWKYFGIIGSFLFGIALSWWGINILLYQWLAIRTSMGIFGDIVLMPLAVGFGVVVMSFMAFMSLIESKKTLIDKE